MPDSGDIQQVAEILRDRLGDGHFLTVERGEITDLVRTVSGDGATRVKRRMSAELEQRLAHLGIRTHPTISDTRNRVVRLFPVGGAVARLVDTITEPGRTDADLAACIDHLPH